MECVRNNFQFQENVCEATRKLEKVEKALASACEDIVKVEREKGLLVKKTRRERFKLPSFCQPVLGIKPWLL